MKDESIGHVTDTALWIAAYRALESERSDALFHDPLARELAGSKGFEIVQTTPDTRAMAFAMVMRTTAIDRLINRAIQNGVDSIVNLGAGLDTRPYRMKLPSALHWVEVDFMNIISYKNSVLRNHKPACLLNRVAADLSKESERRDVFEKLATETSKALVITEGVIGYLSNQAAALLSEDLFAVPQFKYWIMDYAQGKHWRGHNRKLNKKLVNAPLVFSEPDPIGFFQQHGWRVDTNIGILDEADRNGRKVPLPFPWSLAMVLFPRKVRQLGNSTYGYVTLSKPD